MWYISTMEYYSAAKNYVILKFTGKWTQLGKTILSEVSQTQKDKHAHSKVDIRHKEKDNKDTIHNP